MLTQAYTIYLTRKEGEIIGTYKTLIKVGVCSEKEAIQRVLDEYNITEETFIELYKESDCYQGKDKRRIYKTVWEQDIAEDERRRCSMKDTYKTLSKSESLTQKEMIEMICKDTGETEEYVREVLVERGLIKGGGTVLCGKTQ